MHDLYHDGSLEGWPVPSALAGAAQLRASDNSSYWHTVIVFKTPSSPERQKGRGEFKKLGLPPTVAGEYTATLF